MAFKKLEEQIEDVRHQMYLAHKNGDAYSRVLKLSQKLDQLLNQLKQPVAK